MQQATDAKKRSVYQTEHLSICMENKPSNQTFHETMSFETTRIARIRRSRLKHIYRHTQT